MQALALQVSQEGVSHAGFGLTGLSGGSIPCRLWPFRFVRRKYPMQALALQVSQEEVSHAGSGLTG